jgi:hypothetical protein
MAGKKPITKSDCTILLANLTSRRSPERSLKIAAQSLETKKSESSLPGIGSQSSRTERQGWVNPATVNRLDPAAGRKDAAG